MFTQGDTVRLRSGGPKMTFVKTGDYWGTEKALCYWFEGSKKVEDVFETGTIELVPASGLGARG